MQGKQEVAFARALLRNPLILPVPYTITTAFCYGTLLLLDEATSPLDSLTEKKNQDAMAALRQQRTNIIVAHWLSTIMDADVIVVLKVNYPVYSECRDCFGNSHHSNCVFTPQRKA